MENAAFYRAVERILIVCGGILFGCLGYALFRLGVERGAAKFSGESKLFRFVLSGTAPGLVFMLTGGVVLITSMVTQVHHHSTISRARVTILPSIILNTNEPQKQEERSQ